MELMDQTDILIIAGGDGTLQEVPLQSSNVKLMFLTLRIIQMFPHVLFHIGDNWPTA